MHYHGILHFPSRNFNIIWAYKLKASNPVDPLWNKLNSNLIERDLDANDSSPSNQVLKVAARAREDPFPEGAP